mgnify:CR=1 FL=1
MDSLYIRLKFGMPVEEFGRIVRQHPNLERLRRYLQVQESTHPRIKYVLKQPLRFLDWAKTSELYDEAQLENLEWLICQELMKEMV